MQNGTVKNSDRLLKPPIKYSESFFCVGPWSPLHTACHSSHGAASWWRRTKRRY